MPIGLLAFSEQRECKFARRSSRLSFIADCFGNIEDKNKTKSLLLDREFFFFFWQLWNQHNFLATISDHTWLFSLFTDTKCNVCRRRIWDLNWFREVQDRRRGSRRLGEVFSSQGKTSHLLPAGNLHCIKVAIMATEMANLETKWTIKTRRGNPLALDDRGLL